MYRGSVLIPVTLISRAFSKTRHISIALIELSLINILAPPSARILFLHHYDHITTSPEQSSTHVQIYNDVFTIVSSLINLILSKQQVFLVRY
jgi:hypothetical protein